MIQLFDKDIRLNNRQSSKGNQLKWYRDNFWYKADYTGYEGLSEYMISNLLRYSTLKSSEYVTYQTEQMQYGRQIYNGCSSPNFLNLNWQLITLERLFQSHYKESLYKTIFSIDDHTKRLSFLVDYVVRTTGLKDFGVYMSKLLTIDALFLNEDRHTHNIAVLLDPNGYYHYCPIFDNGAGLLSDTTMDYPLNAPIFDLLEEVSSKTFSFDFEEQLDIAEQLYGQHIKFHFSANTIQNFLETENYYPADVKKRVSDLLLEQRRKYQYLFS